MGSCIRIIHNLSQRNVIVPDRKKALGIPKTLIGLIEKYSSVIRKSEI